MFKKCSFCGSHENVFSGFRGAENPFELSLNDVWICLKCAQGFYVEIEQRRGLVDDNETVSCDFCRCVHLRIKCIARQSNAICIFDLQILKDFQHENTKDKSAKKRFNYGFGAWFEQGEIVTCTVKEHVGRLGQACAVIINEYNIPARLICGSYYRFDIGEDVSALVSARDELGLLTLIPADVGYGQLDDQLSPR